MSDFYITIDPASARAGTIERVFQTLHLPVTTPLVPVAVALHDTGDERDGTTPDAWIVDINALPASRLDVLVGYVKAQFGDGRPDDIIRADLLQNGFPILDGDDVTPSITNFQRWI